MCVGYFLKFSGVYYVFWQWDVDLNMFIRVRRQARLKETSLWVDLGLCWPLLWIHQSVSQKLFSPSIRSTKYEQRPANVLGGSYHFVSVFVFLKSGNNSNFSSFRKALCEMVNFEATRVQHVCLNNCFLQVVFVLFSLLSLSLLFARLIRCQWKVREPFLRLFCTMRNRS